ncbi:hypothetical protein AJ80_00624 [Polytolypa hystricis UAMH7299]|uniref:Rho-GAP domain-containing protein n=1 Tax=Polytolypa hystricis (strain UAMH7299) TaxID=1447883 RepID=A0A2B7Z2N4_POLH7|nr:hypothetical protein AJ80_00624 [Polytolypa hystricis UAMH7299]
MAAGNSNPGSHNQFNAFPRLNLQPPQSGPTAPSPPSKLDLTSWWKQFKRNAKKDEETASRPSGIFGVPLNVSIKYANVAISLTGDDGQSFIYGYVPIVVAKCGVFLKEKATDVEGIFRLSGSAKRIKDLQESFDSPDRYGKGLDWTGYTVHDAANILRRYLNQLPEPIVPLDFYERFRDPLRDYQSLPSSDGDAKAANGFDHDKAVTTYQNLIKELPALNRQLLLYILDLLTVFASKSEVNRMTAANLAAIFQPGMLSHPAHDMAPPEYKLSQDVLIFLIENQDNFLFGMTGTAADEQTVKDVQNASQHAHSGSRSSNIRRSASNASAGADSLRKYEALRRNISVSSKHSKASAGNPASPATPNSVGGGSFGVHRSNTVPSKRMQGRSPNQFARGGPEPSTPPSARLSPSAHSRHQSRSPSLAPSVEASKEVNLVVPGTGSPMPHNNAGLGVVNTPLQFAKPTLDDNIPSHDLSPPPAIGTPPALTPSKERKLASFFARSTPPEPERKDTRQPNRLKKRRPIPGSASESAQSSTHSLHHGSDDPSINIPPLFPVPTGDSATLMSQSVSTPKLPNTSAGLANNDATPQLNNPGKPVGNPALESTLKPERSRASSIHSRSSAADNSDADHLDDAAKAQKRDNRRSWRFHRQPRAKDDRAPLSVSPPPLATSISGTGFSTSSVGSSNWPKSSTNDSHQPSFDTSAGNGYPPSFTVASQDSDIGNTAQTSVLSAGDRSDGEKKGFFGKFKAKVAQVREGVKDWEAEKDRAKSPPRSDNEKSSSRNSLSLFSSREGSAVRGAPADVPRDNRAPEAATPSPQTAPIVSQPTSAPTPAPTALANSANAEEKGTVATASDPGEVVSVLPKVEENASLEPPSTAETVKHSPTSTAEPDQTTKSTPSV